MNVAAGIEGAGTGKALESAAWQAMAIAVATVFIAALHWHNDGLWFQGDAPRHALNGLFFWDLVTSLPADPLEFTLSYYARYPVIAPGAYPPLFYVLEGTAFWAVAPSAHVAKALVLSFAAMAGIYVMLWGRRWIAPVAGWAGACAVLLPGFVRYSNAILLNVPATALGLAALYHFHAWLDNRNRGHGNAFILLAIAMVLTYFPAAVVFPVGVAWVLCTDRRVPTRALWLLPAILLVLILLAASLVPGHLARHAPSIGQLFNVSAWTYYVEAVSLLTGMPLLIFGCCGLLCALASRRRRPEAARLALAFPAVIACLVLLPAREARYALLLAPMMVLAVFLGIVAVAEVSGRARAVTTGAIVAVLAVAGASAQFTLVQVVSGFDQVALYLRSHAPNDAVLYAGRYDGVFGFYVRALDPGFDRRLALSNKVLYRYEQRADFQWVETSHVASPADVVTLIQRQSGCQWVAVEIGPEELLTKSDEHLHRALEGPEFERVRSFPVTAGLVVRVDLYRVLPPVEAAPTVEVSVPSFSARVFPAVEPIRRRQ